MNRKMGYAAVALTIGIGLILLFMSNTSKITDIPIGAIKKVTKTKKDNICNMDCSVIPYSTCVEGTCTDPYYTMLFYNLKNNMI
jgi:hypothetical protein